MDCGVAPASVGPGATTPVPRTSPRLASMTVTPDPVGGGAMRASDTERAKIVSLLDDAYADGRLDVSEHEERVAAALESRTWGQLHALTADLGLVAEATPSSPSVPVVPGPREGRIISIMSTARRGSGDVLAESTTLFALMGEARLNLVAMPLAAHDVTVSLAATMSEVIVLVPEGLRIIDRTTAILAETKVRGLPAPPPHAPSVTFTGPLVMSELDVYGPEHPKFERYLRRWS